MKPVWLLDIDGPVNANRPGWGAAPRKATCAGLTIRWAPALIVRIHELRRAGLVDIRWCSTWCGYPGQLAELERVVGLRLESAIGDRSLSRTWADLKVEAVENALAAGHRVVWTDDDEVAAARALRPEIATAEADGRALLIQPKSNRGLQPADLDEIEAFCAAEVTA